MTQPCSACGSTGKIDGRPCPFCTPPAAAARQAFWWRWAWVRMSRRMHDAGAAQPALDAVRARARQAILRHRAALQHLTTGGAA